MLSLAWMAHPAVARAAPAATTQAAAAPQSTAARQSAPRADSGARELLKELIEINTTHAHGSTEAARALAKHFIDGGFAPEDVVLAIPADHPTKGNLVVRLRGQGHGKPVLYIGHLDVVEAKREDWSVEPFKLTEKDGWLYGRGVIDMKGQDVAVAVSLLRLKREGFRPARDVIAAFTADEEAGGDANGVQWLLEHQPQLVDAGLVINPDGGEAGVKSGRKLYVAVQTSEKMVLTFAIEATDKGGHSSRPTAANPIYRLSTALTRIAALQFPLHVTDTTRLYFTRRATLAEGQTRADMEAVGRGTADAASVGRLSSEVETNIMLRTTCTATMVDGGHAENALPQRARALIQCRVIPGESSESVEALLRKTIADPSIVISTRSPGLPAPESPPDPKLIADVEELTRAMWPRVIVLPEMSPGATDSIYTRNHGIPSYGIDAMFDDLDDARAHGRDERIGVAAFAEDVEFTYRLIKRLGSSAAAGS